MLSEILLKLNINLFKICNLQTFIKYAQLVHAYIFQKFPLCSDSAVCSEIYSVAIPHLGLKYTDSKKKRYIHIYACIFIKNNFISKCHKSFNTVCALRLR